MREMDESTVKQRVSAVLDQLKENPLGLRVASVHCIDGRWWAFLEVSREPEHRPEVWDALAEIEERLEEEDFLVTVAAA
jgi:hypothetical protein